VFQHPAAQEKMPAMQPGFHGRYRQPELFRHVFHWKFIDVVQLDWNPEKRGDTAKFAPQRLIHLVPSQVDFRRFAGDGFVRMWLATLFGRMVCDQGPPLTASQSKKAAVDHNPGQPGGELGLIGKEFEP